MLAQRVQYLLEAAVDQEVVRVHQAQMEQVDQVVVEMVVVVQEQLILVVEVVENIAPEHQVQVDQESQS
jgi:hypothetical protein